jgi:hypothetical protein
MFLQINKYIILEEFSELFSNIGNAASRAVLDVGKASHDEDKFWRSSLMEVVINIQNYYSQMIVFFYLTQSIQAKSSNMIGKNLSNLEVS